MIVRQRVRECVCVNRRKKTHQMLFPQFLAVKSISLGDTLISLLMLMTCRALGKNTKEAKCFLFFFFVAEF